MSVQVLFAQYSKRNNSTSRFTDHSTSSGGTVVITELSCFLKEGTDSENPAIRIQVNFVPTNFNVCYIYGFDRYYWIRKWEYNRSEWVAYCEIDSLATMREEIRNADFYILRADRDCTDIDDLASDYAYPTKNDIIVKRTDNVLDYTFDPFKFDLINGSYQSHSFYNKTSTIDGEMIRGWCSIGATITEMTSYYSSLPSNASTVGMTSYILMDYETTAQFIKSFYNPNAWIDIESFDNNPLQYIKQAVFIPKSLRDIPLRKRVTSVKFGFTTNSPIIILGLGYLISQRQIDTSTTPNTDIEQSIYTDDDRYIRLKDHPLAVQRGRYLNYEPYSKMELVFNGLCRFEIPRTAIPPDYDAIHIKFRTDLTNGRTLILIYAAKYKLLPIEHFEDSDILVFQSEVMLGFPIQLAQLNADVKSGVIGMISAAGEMIGGLSTAAVGVLAGSFSGGVGTLMTPMLASGGGTSAISGFAKLASSYRQTQIPRYSTAGSESISLINYFEDPFIQFTFINIADEDFDETGRIVNKTRKISNLRLYPQYPQAYHGYLKVLNGDFASIYTQHEKDIAKKYLESGFFFEE